VENPKLTLEIVETNLLSLLVHYPESGINGSALSILAEDYTDDLLSEYISIREFLHSVKMVRKRCLFFPKVKDFLDAIKEFRDSPKYLQAPDRFLLPEETCEHDITEEERQHNMEMVENIRKMLAGEMSMDDAIAAAEPPREFSGRLGKPEQKEKGREPGKR